MDCAEETTLIRSALRSNPAITDIQFDLIRSFVEIAYDESQTTARAIAAAIDRTGLAAHEAPEAAELHAAAELHTHAHHHPQGEYSTLWTVASGALFAAGWVVDGLTAHRWFEIFLEHAHDVRASGLYALSAAVALWPTWPRAIASLRQLRLDMHVLVCVTVLGAALVGEWSEGAAVAFLFGLAHRLEAWSIERARFEISRVARRDPVILARGLHHPAPVERWIERFAAVYTPAVTFAAAVVIIVPPLLAGDWALWFYRGLVFLVLACPCALVISTPVTIVAAISSAARRGVLVQGGAVLERIARATGPSRPALAAASVSVRDAREADTLEAIDVVVVGDEPVALAFLVGHARRALGVIRQNVAIALLTKLAFLISAPFGFAPLWMAVAADTGATVVVTLNALRLLRVESGGARIP